jgi:hypothetical protein
MSPFSRKKVYGGKNQIKRFSAPDPPKNSVGLDTPDDGIAIGLVGDLIDSDRVRCQQIEDQLSTLATSNHRYAAVFEYLRPSIIKMKSIIPSIREEGRSEVRKYYRWIQDSVVENDTKRLSPLV